jgi:hypothetical protein
LAGGGLLQELPYQTKFDKEILKPFGPGPTGLPSQGQTKDVPMTQIVIIRTYLNRNGTWSLEPGAGYGS